MSNMLPNHFSQPVILWNNHFPLDRWWRKKYNTPFGSDAHLSISQTHIFFEYTEEMLFKESVREEQEMITKYQKLNDGEWLSPAEITDEDFDNIVLD